MARDSAAMGKRRTAEAGGEVTRSAPRPSPRPLLRRVRRLTAGLSHHRAPVWSQDGRHLAFLLGEGDDSYWVVIDRKGRLSRVITGPADGGASFALDGSLAYGRAVGATSEIWLLPALAATSKGPTGARRLLGGDGRLYLHPAFSPDGRYLAYVADDGLPGTARRLWCLDLQTDEHSLLLAALPGPDTPSRLAYPVWSPTGDGLYFEAQTAEGSVIYVLPQPGATTPLRLSAGGYRRPAPLGGGAVLCERGQPDGGSDLVVLLHPPAPTTASTATGLLAQVQEVPLRLGKSKRDGHDCLRDPAIGRGKRGLWLAFAATTHHADGEPARCELFTARVEGLRAAPSRARGKGNEADKDRQTVPPVATDPVPPERAAVPPVVAADEPIAPSERP